MAIHGVMRMFIAFVILLNERPVLTIKLGAENGGNVVVRCRVASADLLGETVIHSRTRLLVAWHFAVLFPLIFRHSKICDDVVSSAN